MLAAMVSGCGRYRRRRCPPLRTVTSLAVPWALAQGQIDAPMFVKAFFSFIRGIGKVPGFAEVRTRQGWAARCGGQALIRSRGQQAGEGPGAAGKSIQGQHRGAAAD